MKRPFISHHLRHRQQVAFSLLELLIVIALVGFLATISVRAIKTFNNPVNDSAIQLERLLKQVRLKAMATTSARVVTRETNGNNNILAVYSMDYCRNGEIYRVTQGNKGIYSEDNPFGLDTSFIKTTLVFDEDVSLNTQSKWWWVCFDSQGKTKSYRLEDSNRIIIKDEKGREKGVRIYTGGDIRITDADGNVEE